MFLTKQKKNLKIILRAAIFCFCASLTFWRAWLCFERYFERAQSINLDIVESSKVTLPDISFCIQTSPFNKTILEICGIQNYTSEWTSKVCPDGDQLSNLVQIPSEKFIKKAFGAFRSPFISEKLNVTSLPKLYKHCFTITLGKPYDRIFIQFTNDVSKVYIHALGDFNNVLINGVVIDPKVHINLDYEIFIKKSTLTDTCNDTEFYNRDECMLDELNQKSMTTIGCIAPFGLGHFGHQINVCKGPPSSNIALNLYDQYMVQKNHTCQESCIKTLMHYTEKKENDKKEIRINFPKQIKLFTAYYSYEILSLMAEIGGYIGLLLGISLLDCFTFWVQILKQ